MKLKMNIIHFSIKNIFKVINEMHGERLQKMNKLRPSSIGLHILSTNLHIKSKFRDDSKENCVGVMLEIFDQLSDFHCFYILC